MIRLPVTSIWLRPRTKTRPGNQVKYFGQSFLAHNYYASLHPLFLRVQIIFSTDMTPPSTRTPTPRVIKITYS